MLEAGKYYRRSPQNAMDNFVYIFIYTSGGIGNYVGTKLVLEPNWRTAISTHQMTFISPTEERLWSEITRDEFLHTAAEVFNIAARNM